MIVERIEYVVNTTTRFVVDLWVRQWPLLLLTLWAVLNLWIAVNLTSTVVVVTNVAVAVTSFAGTVACLKVFRLERCFWIYLTSFIGFLCIHMGGEEVAALQHRLHLEGLDEYVVWRIAEAVQWTGIVALLSSGIYFLCFRHRISPTALIKIPLTVFCMYVFLQPVFMLTWFILIMQVYDILGIPE